MNEEFTTKEFYEVVYSQYEQIFVNGLMPTEIDDTLDQTFTLTIEQPTNGAQIIVTTLDDGVEHTSTIEDMYFRRAYMVKFKNNDGKGLYLNDLGGLIEQDRTIKAIDPATMQDRCAMIMLQVPNQTIFSAIGDDQFTLTESYFVEKGTTCHFLVIPDNPAEYKPGILNFRDITANEDVYYIYATLPLPIDPRLNTEDYYIIDCGHAITTVNEIADPPENAITYYDNTEYLAVYIDSTNSDSFYPNCLGFSGRTWSDNYTTFGKMIPASRENCFCDEWFVSDEASIFSLCEWNFDFDKSKPEPYPCTNFSSLEVNLIDKDGNKIPIMDVPVDELNNGQIQGSSEIAGSTAMNIVYQGRYQPWEEIFNKYYHQWVLLELHFRDWKKEIDYTEKDDDLIFRQDDLFLIECGDSDDTIVSEEELKNQEL